MPLMCCAPTGADGIIDIYSGATFYIDQTGDFSTDRGLNLAGGSGTVRVTGSGL